MLNLESLCKQVISLSGKTGKFILSEQERFSSGSIEKKGFNDLVSYVDKTAEKMLVEELRNILPEAGFIAEENTVARSDSKYTWIIDPLDGTTNFIHGVPCYCISIALVEDKEPVIGIVHELTRNECFYAWKNGGAFLNGKKIRVSAVDRLSDSLLATGFPYHDYSLMESYMKIFDYCMRNTHGLRRLGSAAADLAYVACGRFELFYEYGLNAWDVAAGVLLVKEAGGKVADFRGGEDYIFGKEIIAANAGTFDEFADVVRKIFQ